MYYCDERYSDYIIITNYCITASTHSLFLFLAGIDGDRAENLLLAHYNKEDAGTAETKERHRASDNHNTSSSSPNNNNKRRAVARHESTDDELDNTTAKRARPSQ